MGGRKWIRLRWETETRYYEAHVHRDLWGQWTVTRVWGGLGTARGGSKETPCRSYADALGKLEEIRRRRGKHGYVAVCVA